MILSGGARLAGVMGWPVAHSRSPRIHGYWLEEKGIDGAYLPLAVRPEALGAALMALPALGFRGCNLTAPHKEAALANMASLSETARRIGAVNTVTVCADGALHGDNTDGFGFISHLRQEAPSWEPALPVAMLGAGGAARAVVDALSAEGVTEIRVANRSPERAAALAAATGDAVLPSPLGGPQSSARRMRPARSTPRNSAKWISLRSISISNRLPAAAVVYDLVYAPLETDLLRAAQARGNVTVDGLGMLIHQARPGFAAWFGVEAEATAALRTFAADGL